jgi:para-nitrobenzyl esterase
MLTILKGVCREASSSEGGNMADRSLTQRSDTVRRRTLLKCAVGLAGGAAASIAQPFSTASAQNRAAADAKSGGRLKSPNYHPPLVEVQAGKLRGCSDGRTTTFLGIPYAEADRFELPKPVTPWVGIKSAQVWGPVCPIPDMTEPGSDEFVFPHRYWLQNEHCQVLNVWTQSTSRIAKKPVMVWFHGGGFVNGSSMESYAYTGKNLSEYGDVVVVSMNHRLNVIGALDLSAYGPEHANSRYTGAADMVAALQWVHDNIETFGGDPGNVTIFGQSAGGSEVTRMLHTPAAKGLFHRVIAESGGGENIEVTHPAEMIRTQQMIAAATLENLSLRGDQIDKLKAISYPQLLAAGNAALTAVAQKLGRAGLGWKVIADDRYILRKFCDWAGSIPLMAGNTFSESVGTLDKGTGKNEWSEKEIDDRLTAEYGKRKDEVIAEFSKAFPRKKVQDVLYYSTGLRVRLKALLTRKLAVSQAPAYSYIFAYEYPVNGGITAFHCSEIAFAFHNLTIPEVKIATGGAPAALALQDKVSQAWINFARTGNPWQRSLDWKPFTARDPQTMVFDVLSECRAFHDEKLNSLV